MNHVREYSIYSTESPIQYWSTPVLRVPGTRHHVYVYHVYEDRNPPYPARYDRVTVQLYHRYMYSAYPWCTPLFGDDIVRPARLRGSLSRSPKCDISRFFIRYHKTQSDNCSMSVEMNRSDLRIRYHYT